MLKRDEISCLRGLKQPQRRLGWWVRRVYVPSLRHAQGLPSLIFTLFLLFVSDVSCFRVLESYYLVCPLFLGLRHFGCRSVPKTKDDLKSVSSYSLHRARSFYTCFMTQNSMFQPHSDDLVPHTEARVPGSPPEAY